MGEAITDELIERCAQAGWGAERDDVLDLDNVYRRIAIGVLRAAGQPGGGPMSDVAILRRAASALRERAGNATPGPWEADGTLPRWVLAPREEWDLGEGRQRIAHMCMPYREERKWANAAYITLMHPPVALALADWLDDEAARGLGKPDNVAAYAVARAVLREAGE